MRTDAAAWARAAGLTALVASLPFLRGLARGASFYFRDLGGQFIPLRLFAVDGLREGELRYWNPFSYEGVPMSDPPLSYPFDLVHVLLPDHWGISLSLALHIPAAGAAFVWLGRRLGLTPVAAAAGGLIYALGGFALSTLNLYVYVKALAWAPLLAGAMLGCAASGSRRAISAVAASGAIAISTTGVELVLQAVLLGLVLSLPRLDARRALALGLGLAIAVCLSAPTILVLSGLAADSARGAGFPAEVVLSQSIHPLTWLQVVLARLHGDVSNLAEGWWGDNFFPRGFPYVLSLYLGATVLALAALGGLLGRGPRGRLALLLVLGVVVSLGRWAGLEPLVEAVPAVRALRFPTKAFFLVHTSVALLAALGVDALGRDGGRRAWAWLCGIALFLGGVLSLSGLLPGLAPGWTSWFVAGYFPPRLGPEVRLHLLGVMLRDAAAGGAVAAAAGGVAILALRGSLRPVLGQVALLALVAADLLRAGAGLNPMVAPGFFELSSGMQGWAERIREERGRAFSCDVTMSDAYQRFRHASPGRHELLTFALLRESFSPDTNVPREIPTALSTDRTMLVPEARVLPYDEAGCDDLATLLPRLRSAAVTHVISADPLEHTQLRLRESLSPRSIRPLRLFVYALASPLPFAEVVPVPDGAAPEVAGRVLSLGHRPGRIAAHVQALADAHFVVREAFAPGWRAYRDGVRVPTLCAGGRHLAVEVPVGRSEVELRYRPPGLAPGLALAVLGVLALAALWVAPVLRRGKRD